jgi:predicted MPP superfamily phosphohydrolase
MVLLANQFFTHAVNRRNIFAFTAHAYPVLTLQIPLFLAIMGGLLLFARARLQAGRLTFWGAIICITAALGGWGIRVWATHIEPKNLQVHHVQIALPQLKQPVRLLHATDLQAAQIGKYEIGAALKMAKLKPDLVIHTGDLLQPVAPASVESELPKLQALWDSVPAPLGKYNVMGDVDQPTRRASREGRAGIPLIEGFSQAIPLPEGGRLRIFGLTLEQSRAHGKGLAVIEPWLETARPDDVMIVAGHAPDFILDVTELPIDLCLAGHTHGGQIRVPWLGPIVWASRVPSEWARGYHEVGKTRFNVSAGIGAEHVYGMPSIRLNCPPEMTLIELVPAAK